MADRRRLRRIVDRLAAEYGRPVLRPHGAPVDELVLTVLSQNTNDRNRDVAYGRLRERFPSWDAVRHAPRRRDRGRDPPRRARARRSRCASGRSSTRSATTTSLHLADDPLDEARAELCALPGVGRKTAACVLLFSFGRPDVPVDTHVYRVGGRLGLWPQKASFDRAHDELLRLVRRRRRLRLRDARAADPARPAHLRRPARPAARSARCGGCARRGSAASRPPARAAPPRRMSEDALRRRAEVAPRLRPPRPLPEG